MCHRAGLRKKIELSKKRKVPEWCRNKMMLVLPGKGVQMIWITSSLSAQAVSCEIPTSIVFF